MLKSSYVRMALPVMLGTLAACASAETGALSSTPPVVPDVVLPDWQQVTDPRRCAEHRQSLGEILSTAPVLSAHVFGAWSLCAVAKGATAVAVTMNGRLREVAEPDSVWARTLPWLDVAVAVTPAVDAFPTYAPPLGRNLILARLVTRAAASPQAPWAQAFFVQWPGLLAWDGAGRERMLQQLSDEQLQRVAWRLYRLGRVRSAFGALEQVWDRRGIEDPVTQFDQWSSGGGDGERLQQFGRLAFLARRYAMAEAVGRRLAEMPAYRPSGILLWGRALARQGHMLDAGRLWERKLDQVEGTPYAAPVLYRLGLVAEEFNRKEEAQSWYARAARASDGDDREEAAFRAGWLLAFGWNVSGAVDLWQAELRRKDLSITHRRRVQYWLASVATDSELRRKTSRALAHEGPLSFYYWLLDPAAAAATAVTWVASSVPAISAELETRLAIPRQLEKLGWFEPAAGELWSVYRTVSDPHQKLRLLFEAQALGDVHRSLVNFWQLRGYEFRADPPRYRRDLWELLYPRPWLEEVTRQAQRYGVDPNLVHAIMREESRFQADVISPAGAIGLLQVIPPTAKRVAQTYSLPYRSREDLADPTRNIPIGTAYIAELLRRYNGNRFRAVAAYNAGPGAVDRWVTQRPGISDDRWAEEIPYTETRRYVRKVLRSHIRYTALYGSASTQPGAGRPVTTSL